MSNEKNKKAELASRTNVDDGCCDEDIQGFDAAPDPRRTRPLEVYVAGGWKFRNRIKTIMDRLRSDDRFHVVSGWVERENGYNAPSNLANDARCDIDEVTAADVVLAIMEDDKYAYRGTFTEIGCALGQSKPVIVVCPGTAQEGRDGQYVYSHYCQTNVFYHHALAKHVGDVDAAIEALLTLRAKQQ